MDKYVFIFIGLLIVIMVVWVTFEVNEMNEDVKFDVEVVDSSNDLTVMDDMVTRDVRSIEETGRSA